MSVDTIQELTNLLRDRIVPGYSTDCSILCPLKTEKNRLKKQLICIIKKLHENDSEKEFCQKLIKVKREIETTFESIIHVIQYIESSQNGNAESEFNKIMDSLKQYLVVTSMICGQQLFRIRQSEEKLKNKTDLFHIPFEKKHLISSQRYSIAGTPCLYLSDSFYTAWQECGYPTDYYYATFTVSLSNVKVIVLENPNQFAVNIQSSPVQDNPQVRNSILSYLRTYPLIYACSLINQNRKSPYKQEYLISQQLLQWLYRNNSFAKGIKYFPVNSMDYKNEILSYNYAFPAIQKSAREKYSKDLLAVFNISNPTKSRSILSQIYSDKVGSFCEELLQYNKDAPRGMTLYVDAFLSMGRSLYVAMNSTCKENMENVLYVARSVANCGDLLSKINFESSEEGLKDEILRLFRKFESEVKNTARELYEKWMFGNFIISKPEKKS